MEGKHIAVAMQWKINFPNVPPVKQAKRKAMKSFQSPNETLYGLRGVKPYSSFLCLIPRVDKDIMGLSQQSPFSSQGQWLSP
jgi:hypothetical protein